MEIIELLLTPQVLTVVLMAVIIVLYRLIVVDRFEHEFGTVVQIIEIIAERHDIEPVEILREALEEAGKLDEYTGDFEKVAREELRDIKKD